MSGLRTSTYNGQSVDKSAIIVTPKKNGSKDKKKTPADAGEFLSSICDTWMNDVCCDAGFSKCAIINCKRQTISGATSGLPREIGYLQMHYAGPICRQPGTFRGLFKRQLADSSDFQDAFSPSPDDEIRIIQFDDEQSAFLELDPESELTLEETLKELDEELMLEYAEAGGDATPSSSSIPPTSSGMPTSNVPPTSSGMPTSNVPKNAAKKHPLSKLVSAVLTLNILMALLSSSNSFN